MRKFSGGVERENDNVWDFVPAHGVEVNQKCNYFNRPGRGCAAMDAMYAGLKACAHILVNPSGSHGIRVLSALLDVEIMF